MATAKRVWRKGIKSARGAKSKYKNKKVVYDGFKFDSIREKKRYMELKLLEKAGDIEGFRLQVPYPFTHDGKIVCTYIADFVYFDHAKDGLVVEDCKGFRTDMYKLKRKMMKIWNKIEIFET